MSINTSSSTRYQRVLFATILVAFVPAAITRLAGGEIVIVGQPRHADDEAPLRASEEASGHATQTRDYAALERLWSENFVVNAPNNAVYSSRAAVLNVFRHS